MRVRQLVRVDGTILETDKERESTPDYVCIEILGEPVVFKYDETCEQDGVTVELYHELGSLPVS